MRLFIMLFWLGIYGSVLAKTAQVNGTEPLLMYSSMIFLGLTLWDILVAALTNGLRRFLNISSLRFISIISGVSLVGLAYISDIKELMPFLVNSAISLVELTSFK